MKSIPEKCSPLRKIPLTFFLVCGFSKFWYLERPTMPPRKTFFVDLAWKRLKRKFHPSQEISPLPSLSWKSRVLKPRIRRAYHVSVWIVLQCPQSHSADSSKCKRTKDGDSCEVASRVGCQWHRIVTNQSVGFGNRCSVSILQWNFINLHPLPTGAEPSKLQETPRATVRDKKATLWCRNGELDNSIRSLFPDSDRFEFALRLPSGTDSPNTCPFFAE